MNSKNNFFTFFSIYIAQQIPMTFFATIIPVIMRQEKYSVATITTVIFILKLPWILKFLWSPIVDKFNVTVKDYKRWIILSELVFAAFIVSVIFFDFHSTTSFYIILVLVILACFASANGDIAADALATQAFERKDKSMLNSMQNMGHFGGTVVGAGVLLWVFDKYKGFFDSNHLYLTPFIALFVVIALLPLIFNRGINITRDHSVVKKVGMDDILQFFTQPGMWKQILFLMIYYVAITAILPIFTPYLVDLGLEMKQIGTMRGFFGAPTGLLSAFLGGLIIRKIGRHHSRILFSCLIVFASFYLFYISRNPHPEIQLLYIAIILIWGSYGMAAVILYTIAMDCTRKGREGTDFTIQIVIAQLSGLIVMKISGKIADVFGYGNSFLFAFAIACMSLIYVLTVFRKKEIHD